MTSNKNCNIDNSNRYIDLAGTIAVYSSSNNNNNTNKTNNQLGLFNHFILLAGTKRKYPEDEESENGGSGGSSKKVEEWSLRDVIFVDHVTNLNVGSVLKLDGSYAAVHYPALDDHQDLSQVDISRCRLLRKEELVVSC